VDSEIISWVWRVEGGETGHRFDSVFTKPCFHQKPGLKSTSGGRLGPAAGCVLSWMEELRILICQPSVFRCH